MNDNRMMGRHRHDQPLDLGAMTPDGAASEPPDRPERSDESVPSRWRRRAAIGAALIVGAVGGSAVTEARHDTTESVRDDVHVIALGPHSPRPNGEFNDITLGLLNSGSATVQVLGAEVDGFHLVDGGTLREPVTAPPGEWTSVVVPAAPDCRVQPADDVGIRLRTDDGVRSTQTTQLPNSVVFLLAWLNACGTQDGFEAD